MPHLTNAEKNELKRLKTISDERILDDIELQDAKGTILEVFELDLIQTQMAQKPSLPSEVYARALRASQNVKS